MPAAVADAIETSAANAAGGNGANATGTGATGASSPALDSSALTVTRATAAGDAWRLTSGAAVYLVVRRDTPRGSRLHGYACPAAATAAGPPAAAGPAPGTAGVQVLPVSFAAGAGTIRARSESIIWLPAAADATPAAETVTLAAPDPADPTGVLSLQAPLGNVYDGATVQINLNVVAAAQGTPTAVTLGTGQPEQTSQSFTLPTPVAMVASGTVPGDASAEPQSSLAITVGDVPWTQTDTLLTAGKDDRVYTFAAGFDGSGTVRFGDGKHGARLPASPVVATYLQGGGTEGAVAEGTLIQPLDRPQLVQAVHNPQPAQLPPQAPAASPLAQTRLLGRIVTLRDFCDAAQACPGVAGARVQLLGSEPREIVVTLAAAPGADTAALAAGVAQTLRSQATGDLPLRVLPAISVPVVLHVRIIVDRPGVEAALRDCLGGLSARCPGDPLLASQVLAAADGIDGVAGAMIVGWGREGAAQTRRTALPARSARHAGDQRVLTAAELLFIDGRSGRLTITVGGRTATDDGT